MKMKEKHTPPPQKKKKILRSFKCKHLFLDAKILRPTGLLLPSWTASDLWSVHFLQSIRFYHWWDEARWMITTDDIDCHSEIFLNRIFKKSKYIYF